MILALDCSDKTSYPGNGSTWFDLSGQAAHGTLNGGISFVNNGSTSYFNFPSGVSTDYISSTIAQNYLDITIVFQPDFTYVGNGSLVGLIGTSTDAVSADKSLRFNTANGTGPWGLQNTGNPDDWAGSPTTYYVNGTTYIGAGTLTTGWNILGGARTNTTNGLFANPFSYFLGTEGYNGGARDFKGKLAACYMYNRALTKFEQLQNYNTLRYRFGI